MQKPARRHLGYFCLVFVFLFQIASITASDKPGEIRTLNDTEQGGGQASANASKSKPQADKDDKKGKGSNETPEQLHEKQLKLYKAAQEKAIKKQEERLKNKGKDGDKDEDGVSVIPRNSVKVLGPEGYKSGEDKSIFTSNNDGKHALTQLNGAGAPVRMSAGHAVTIESRNKNNDGVVPVLDANSVGALDGSNNEASKPGFFKRLFSKKENEAAPATGLRGSLKDARLKMMDSVVKNTSTSKDAGADFVPAGSGEHETLSGRVQRQMAQIRIKDELEEQGKKHPAKASKVPDARIEQPAAAARGAAGIVAGAGAGAEMKGQAERSVSSLNSSTVPAGEQQADVVELGNTSAPTASLAPGSKVTDKTGTRPNDSGDIGPATEADIKAASEDQYQTALHSRDSIARQFAFERAAIERRADAIPLLVTEVKQARTLAPFAAQCLGSIGKLTPEVEAVLMSCIGNRDELTRQAGIESLGKLKCHRAVTVLIERLKIEKSLNVRSACVNALGLIGDRIAIPALKLKLEDNGEIEFVKNYTALALARLGDPSGRAHLIKTLDSNQPAMQLLGLLGIAQLNDPDAASFFSSALESNDDEVWTTAVYLFPRLGPAMALPILRSRLECPNETLRRRAALAMGFLGSDDAVPYIDRAVRMGGLQERTIGCELLGSLARTDKIPLLIEKLQDPASSVRQTAAVSLTRLNATQAIPALIEATRGVHRMEDLPPALRGAGPDMYERVVILSCVRILRGEKDDLILNTLPNSIDKSWPEFDRALTQQQVELIKLYTLVDVVSADNHPIGAVLKLPDGKEVLFREGETVAAGFKVHDIGLPLPGKDKVKTQPYVMLTRGDEHVTLVEGRAAEVDVKERK